MPKHIRFVTLPTPPLQKSPRTKKNQRTKNMLLTPPPKKKTQKIVAPYQCVRPSIAERRDPVSSLLTWLENKVLTFFINSSNTVYKCLFFWQCPCPCVPDVWLARR